MELLLGCGNNWDKKIAPVIDVAIKQVRDNPSMRELSEDVQKLPREWSGELITLDSDDYCKPHVLHDLNQLPYPFEDDTFDEIHAYEVLEHCGTQGDFRFFFDQFTELHRIMKSGGWLVASCPAWDGIWAWSDPGHTRLISQGSLTFLSQQQYEDQVGKTPMTDYRFCYEADFSTEFICETPEQMWFILRAIK